MSSHKMQIPEFLKSISRQEFSELKEPIDLDAELVNLGAPATSYARIDWLNIKNKVVYVFDHSGQAGDAIRNIININKLKGAAWVIWSDDLTIPVYGLGGVRRRGCMILIQALVWNVGICGFNAKKTCWLLVTGIVFTKPCVVCALASMEMGGCITRAV